MSSKITDASDVKPHFGDVKQVWYKMLSVFFDDNGALKPECVQEVSCPHCGANQPYQDFVLNGFHHHTCQSCQCVYVSPRLKDEHLHQLYADEYYSQMFTESMLPFFDKRKKLIGGGKYAQIQKQLAVIDWQPTPNETPRVLDIGSGLGEVTDVFNDNGWDCHAIEVNPVAVDWLNKKQINVFDGAFDDYKNEQQFDVIMAWGVIEHVVNPKAFLAKAFSLLKPGGLFVSEVPHGNSLLVDYCREQGSDPDRILQGEQHIILYSVPAYKELHSGARFQELHVQTNGLDVSTIVNISNSSMNNDVVAAMQSSVDQRMCGDLLRGFWYKPGNAADR